MKFDYTRVGIYSSAFNIFLASSRSGRDEVVRPHYAAWCSVIPCDLQPAGDPCALLLGAPFVANYYIPAYQGNPLWINRFANLGLTFIGECLVDFAEPRKCTEHSSTVTESNRHDSGARLWTERILSWFIPQLCRVVVVRTQLQSPGKPVVLE